MSREDLFGYYHRYYVPENATLVVVGDVNADDVLRRAEAHFGALSGNAPVRRRSIEPEQIGERRVRLEREGTTAYLKLAWHAPEVRHPDFFPMLVLDAILTGAKGTNLWSSFRGMPPQRKARLYTGLVEKGLASAVGGSLVATVDPFLYAISLTAMKGVALPELEAAALDLINVVVRQGLTDEEVARAKRQLKARLVFETDSVTNIAHQLGYFETVAGDGFFSRLRPGVDAVTTEQVAAVAKERLTADGRTVGWFQPAGVA
jgi:zinc protease